MRKVKLFSVQSTDDGTFGNLLLDDGTTYVTGELPNKGNKGGISCIPAGVYQCRWFNSPKHGWCYQVYGVPGRDMIEIHSANFMGDTSKGKVCQLLGCIALGKSVAKLETFSGSKVFQTAVLASKVAIQEFEANMKQEDFELTIVRAA